MWELSMGNTVTHSGVDTAIPLQIILRRAIQGVSTPWHLEDQKQNSIIEDYLVCYIKNADAFEVGQTSASTGTFS